ncbi:MAG: hypothetical protein ACM3MF_04935 [Anaerolineae bacterium]
MKRAILPLLYALMIVLSPACAAVATNAPIPSTPTATATAAIATPTIVWFPPSETPAVVDLPTAGPTPERKPGVGGLVLTDDFSSEKPWNPGLSEDAGIVISRNQLTLAAQPGVSAFRIRQGPSLTSFYAEITAQPSLCRDTDEYGLLFRAPSNSGYYVYALRCNGTSLAERVRLGKAFPLHDPVASADVPVGPPAEVRLGVWASGTELRFFLNGHYQFRVSDPTLKQGAVGVFAHAMGATPVTIIFSDLSVYNVTYIPPATPTP